MGVLAKALAAAAAGHLGLTVLSLGTGVLRRRPKPSAAQPKAKPCEPCSRQHTVLKTVAKMYSGGGVASAICADDVEFEDPAALCHGAEEVVEAFRALKVCKPEHLTAPALAADSGDGRSAPVVVLLHQRYFGFLEVHSVQCVTLAADGRIRRFEERWNCAPLTQLALPGAYDLARASRRLNGLVSYAGTRAVVK